jgi:dihydropteroate synthase
MIKTKSRFTLAGVTVGGDAPVRLMGVINLSPESFYKGSVPRSPRALAKIARQMEKEGADFIDVGAMSTAPYLKTEISEIEEARRLEAGVRIIRKACSLPISIDTSRRRPAEAGLEAGASILNDVTGLARDRSLALVAREARGVILMAHPSGGKISGKPIESVFRLLKASLRRALAARIPNGQIVLDPGIGFFRTQRLSWWEWDLAVLRQMHALTKLGHPLLIGVSRKSFIGRLMGGVPAHRRLAGSLAATTAAVLRGAAVVRTHDVRATRELLKIIEPLR